MPNEILVNESRTTLSLYTQKEKQQNMYFFV